MSDKLIPIVSGLVPKELSDAVGGTLADVWQVLVGDRISAYRIRNAAALSEKLNEKLADQGRVVDWSRVPERFAVAWFEHATKEDDPELQDLFATLLANAAAGCDEALERRNAELLARFSAADALLFKSIYESYAGEITKSDSGYWLLDEWSAFERETKREEQGFASIAYDNLKNYGIIDIQRESHLDERKLERWVRGQTGQDGGGGLWTTYPVEDAIVAYDQVGLTETGRSLMKALFLV